MQAASLEGGFAAPVLDSQSVFRALMDGFANPGSIRPLRATVSPPQPLCATAGAVALALADADTPLWLDAALMRYAPVREWLAFHCGAPIVDDPSRSAFALVADAWAMPTLSRFQAGQQEYPDRSTTIIVQVLSLEGGAALMLDGPGIRGSRRFRPQGTPRDFVLQWRDNRARFPLGVDMVFCDGDAIACLPRMTTIRGEEA
jgi:alpha-D-ribose 1-methylphosphonate 5-triphosphate synthase subunit PhnH